MENRNEDRKGKLDQENGRTGLLRSNKRIAES
jgi:hypothetical protein